MIIISLHHLERSSSTSWSLLYLLLCPYNHYNHRIKLLLPYLFADQVHRADGEERVINKSCHVIRTKHLLSLCCFWSYVTSKRFICWSHSYSKSLGLWGFVAACSLHSLRCSSTNWFNFQTLFVPKSSHFLNAVCCSNFPKKSEARIFLEVGTTAGQDK